MVEVCGVMDTFIVGFFLGGIFMGSFFLVLWNI